MPRKLSVGSIKVEVMYCTLLVSPESLGELELIIIVEVVMTFLHYVAK